MNQYYDRFLEKKKMIYGNHNHFLKVRRIALICFVFQVIFIALLILILAFKTNILNFDSTLLGYLLIFNSLVPVVYSLYRQNLRLIFTGISVFNIAPIWFLYLESVIPGYDGYIYILPYLKLESYFWCSLFLLSVNFFYYIIWQYCTIYFSKKLFFLVKVKFKKGNAIVLCLISFLLPLAAFAFYYGSFEMLWKAMSGGRSGGGAVGGLLIQKSIGDKSSFMLPLNMLWQLTPFFGTIAFLLLKDKNFILGLICLFFGLFVVFVFFLSGSRGMMIFMLALSLFPIIYFNLNKGVSFWIPFLFFTFFLFGVMELQVRFRGNLLTVIADPQKAAKQYNMKSVTTFDPTETHRDNNFYTLSLVVKGHPTRYPHQGFDYLFAVLLNPIPRALWPGKPLLPGQKGLVTLLPALENGPLVFGTTSITLSIVGEAYLQGGACGIIIYALIYTLLLLFFDGLQIFTREGRPIVIGLLGNFLFLSFWAFRGFFALISFLYPLFLLLIILRFFVKK